MRLTKKSDCEIKKSELSHYISKCEFESHNLSFFVWKWLPFPQKFFIFYLQTTILFFYEVNFFVTFLLICSLLAESGFQSSYMMHLKLPKDPTCSSAALLLITLGGTSGARLNFPSGLTTFSPKGVKRFMLGICFLALNWTKHRPDGSLQCTMFTLIQKATIIILTALKLTTLCY